MIQVKDLKIISTPPTWRRMIDDILSRPIPMISGVMDRKGTIIRFEEYFCIKKNELEEEITELHENISSYKKRIEEKQFDGYFDNEELHDAINRYTTTIKRKLEVHNEISTCSGVQLSTTEAISLLATKNAVHDARSISLVGHKVVLGLSGGMAAEIVFRERGDLYTLSNGVYAIADYDFSDDPFSNSFWDLIFNQYPTKDKYRFEDYQKEMIVRHALYSDVYLYAPKGFCVTTELCVLEIYFHPAPMLFGSGVVSVMSAINKVESDRQSAEEDERRRKEDEDDEYWRKRNDW